MNKDKLWEKTNAAFGGFVPGIHSDMVHRWYSVRHNFLPHMLLHVARYANVAALVGFVGGLVALNVVDRSNWHRDSDIRDFPVMVPGGGANIENGYVIRLPVNWTLATPERI